MIDPRTLRTATLNTLDRAEMVGGHFDRDEPFEIERTLVTNDDVVILAGVPFAADSCLFDGCDLSVTDLIGVKNSLFVNCKLRGARFGKYVRNVVMEACQLNECTFRMMVLEMVTFDRSQIVACDFYESSLTQVRFPGSTFEGLGFDRCTIDDVDLTEAVDLMIADPRTLTGAAICETQVPLIAKRLAELSGIDVRDC